MTSQKTTQPTRIDPKDLRNTVLVAMIELLEQPEYSRSWIQEMVDSTVQNTKLTEKDKSQDDWELENSQNPYVAVEQALSSELSIMAKNLRDQLDPEYR